MCLTECELEVYNKKIKMSQEISKICKKLKFVGKMGRIMGLMLDKCNACTALLLLFLF